MSSGGFSALMLDTSEIYNYPSVFDSRTQLKKNFSKKLETNFYKFEYLISTSLNYRESFLAEKQQAGEVHNRDCEI